MADRNASNDPWPRDIRYKSAEKTLEVDFEDGSIYRYPAEFLRVESPSAEVQGHNPDQKKTIPGRRHVGIASMEPVGNYAIRISFDDSHDTGIFSWRYLYEIGQEQDALWSAYLDALNDQGLSRDP
jgi:DUF971 family protein